MSQLLRQADDKYDRTNDQQTRTTTSDRLAQNEQGLQRKTTTRGGQAMGQGLNTLVNGANNDISLDTATYVRLVGPTGAFSITGIKHGEKGAYYILHNTTSQTMTIANESASSSVNNRIHTPDGSDIVLTSSGGNSVLLQYDTVLLRWVAVAVDLAAAFASGVLAFLKNPTSANLRAAVTDETGTGALVFATSPTLVTPILGTPTSGTLSNCTGYAQSALTGLGTNVSTFLGTPSSANLAAALTDETGTGAAVFANAPALTNPTVTTQSPGNNSTRAASTAYVDTTFSPVLRNLIAVSASRSLALADVGNVLWNNAGGSITLTVPPHATVALPVGAQIDLIAWNTTITIAAGAGVFIGSALLTVGPQFSGAILIQLGQDAWSLVGSLQ